MMFGFGSGEKVAMMGQDSRCEPPHVCTSMSHLASWSCCARGPEGAQQPPVGPVGFAHSLSSHLWHQVLLSEHYTVLCCSGFVAGGSLASERRAVENDTKMTSSTRPRMPSVNNTRRQ